MIDPTAEHVMWHDIECGSYDEDLTLWRRLVAETGGPVADVGAGTGRTTLRLAAGGVDMVAVDLDAAFLDVLERRAARLDLRVETLCTPAQDLSALAGRDLGAVIVPMQTLQLLPDADARRAFYAGARAALRTGGLLAAALAEALEGYDEDMEPPLPDMREVDGVVYSSRPIAVHDEGDGVVIERVRELVLPDGTLRSAQDLIKLLRIDPETVTAEALPCGFAPEPTRYVPPTEEYVGSEVVVLRAV